MIRFEEISIPSTSGVPEVSGRTPVIVRKFGSAILPCDGTLITNTLPIFIGVVISLSLLIPEIILPIVWESYSLKVSVSIIFSPTTLVRNTVSVSPTVSTAITALPPDLTSEVSETSMVNVSPTL